jgi:hypothetical protein
MELILKKGASRQAQIVLNKQLTLIKKKNNLLKWCGIIKLKVSPLDLQKEMRNEWE